MGITIITELDLAYAAGFIDGEGCIDLRRSWYESNVVGITLFYRKRVRVSNTDEEVLLWLQFKFGGNVYFRKTKPKHKPMWSWEIGERDKVEEFLRLLIPFLKVKREEALKVLNYEN